MGKYMTVKSVGIFEQLSRSKIPYNTAEDRSIE